MVEPWEKKWTGGTGMATQCGVYVAAKMSSDGRTVVAAILDIT